MRIDLITALSSTPNTAQQVRVYKARSGLVSGWKITKSLKTSGVRVGR